MITSVFIHVKYGFVPIEQLPLTEVGLGEEPTHDISGCTFLCEVGKEGKRMGLVCLWIITFVNKVCADICPKYIK